MNALKYPTEPLIDIKLAEIEGECVHEYFHPRAAKGKCLKCEQVYVLNSEGWLPIIDHPRAHSLSELVNYAVKNGLPYVLEELEGDDGKGVQVYLFKGIECTQDATAWYRDYDSPAQATRIAGWNTVIAAREKNENT